MEIRQIPLKLVLPSEINPRKTFDEGELQELADNIEKQGLLQPITVRPVRHPSNEYGDRPDKYEIVCGERRYRAFLKLSDKWADMDCVAPAGFSYNRFTEISAIVREMTDEEAFDAMITENLQRKDVSPMEEAFAFGHLIESGKTAEEIAARFGKSIRFVQDRVKLNNLIPELMLAVKDEKMSISAAMIICKLNEEQQKSYYTGYRDNYQGLTKASATQYCNSLFMRLDRAHWNGNFKGGCGKRCADCEFNTTNHGCLFWEMNTDKEDSRCTNRDKWREKNVAYAIAEIEKYGNDLLRKGAPLELGKVVVINENLGCYKEFELTKKAILAELDRRGIEVVDPDKVLGSQCYYQHPDERFIKLKESGQLIHGLKLFGYGEVYIEDKWWYVKSAAKDAESEPTAMGQSVSAMALVAERRRVIDSSVEKYGKKYRELAKQIRVDRKMSPLTNAEQIAFACLIFSKCSQEVREKYGDKGGYMTRDASMIETVRQNIQDLPMWMRDYMRESLTGTDVEFYSFHRNIADKLLAEWKPDEHKAIGEKLRKSIDRRLTKIDEQLKALGYDREGKLLPAEEIPKTETITVAEGTPVLKQYEKMKKSHPDHTLLFRVGDFYETFGEDAEEASKILGLTLTASAGGIKLAGFPHHALDTYLPKLVRAGKRVAICEQLEDPKKK